MSVDLWGTCLGVFLWVSFHSVLRSVVGDNHSLMGGSGDAFASWPVVYFYPFGPFSVFSRIWGTLVFFIPTPWGVSQGLELNSASGVTVIFRERASPSDRASTRITSYL